MENMPQYVMVNEPPLPPPPPEGAERMRIPLREQVARCLDDWEVTSSSSDDSDDICGWRVGSRALPLPGSTQTAARPPVNTQAAARSGLSSFFKGFGRPADAFGTQRAVDRREGSSSSTAAGGTLLEARVRAMRATRAAADEARVDNNVAFRREDRGNLDRVQR